MSNEIINVLNDMCEKLGIAVDWTAENILPEVKTICEHYVSYEWLSSLVVLIFGAEVLTLGITCFISSRTEFAHREDVEGLLFLLGVVLIFIATIIVIIEANDMILCKTFPEKLIFDYLTEALK